MNNIYNFLNNLIEQPFFIKIVELFKFFKLQKTYWSVAFAIIIFVISQGVAANKCEAISAFAQEKIAKSSGDIEKLLWHLFELYFANGSWWLVVLGVFLLILVSLIRYYEVRHPISGLIDDAVYKKYFKSFDSFEHEIQNGENKVEYVNDKKRKDGIEQIRHEIGTVLSSHTSSFIRIEGFSGIGKTRFVYEALNVEEYKKLVLYVAFYTESVLDDLSIFCKKIPNNSREQVIFVIDECPYDEHIKICRHLKSYPNLVVITIDQSKSEQDRDKCRDEKRITLEGLAEAETVDLVRKVNTVLPEDIARKIAYYTEGYPRLACLMAEYYDIETGEIGGADEKSKLLDKILDSVTKQPRDIVLLQAISLFKLFPNTDDLSQYRNIIFAHFEINQAEAAVVIETLIKKGLLRRAGRYLYVSPKPISTHLFNKFLENHDYSKIDGLFHKLDNAGLANSFFDKLQGVAFETSKHKDLLFQILSRLTYEQIADEFGSKIFFSLCLKDRQFAIEILKNLLLDRTKDELKNLENGRRYIVHSLEELISFKDTFADSARLLFSLACAENESWGNNSKGVFIASFQWILGGTEENIVNRLELLRELYNTYTDAEDRVILLDALENAYPKFNYFATHKNQPSVPECIPEHYYPNSNDEIRKYFEILQVVISCIYDISSDEQKEKIVFDIVLSLREFLQYQQIGFWVLDFIEDKLALHSGLKTPFFEQITMTLEYDKDEKLSKDVLYRLGETRDRLINPDNIEKVKELFFATEKYRYNSEDAFDVQCKAVAQDIFNSRDTDGLLDRNKVNLYELGRELALLDSENGLLNDILEMLTKIDKDSTNRFVLGYLFNSSFSAIENYELFFYEIYSRLNDKALMLDFIHYSKPTEVSIKYLFMLLEKNEISHSVLENLTFGFWLRDLSKDEFIQFIDGLNCIIGDKSDSFELCMQYIHKSKDDELVQKYVPYYLEHNILSVPESRRTSYYMDDMIRIYFAKGFELSGHILNRVWGCVSSELDNGGKFEDRRFQPVYKIIKKYSVYFWDKIKNELESRKPAGYPLYGIFIDFLQGGYMSRSFDNSVFAYIEPELIMEWLVNTEYKGAKYIVADSLNIDFTKDYLPELVIALLGEFPNDERLYSSIKCGSESWSGSYVPVANAKIANIETMLEKYKDTKSIVGFLKWAKKIFEHRRDWEKRDDEETDAFYG
ncbi:MAG: hypothetical protein AB7D29_01375 [Campylobacterales bacterium]